MVTVMSDWCPAVFNNNYRNSSNFKEAYFLGLDFDGTLLLEEAKDIFAPFKHIITTSRNHQKMKNNLLVDRFRVILALSEPITQIEDFVCTYLEAMKLWPTDPQCKDGARQFFMGNEIIQVNERGLPFPVKKNLSLHNSTKEFIKSGAPDGQWNGALVKAVRNMQQQKYSAEEILSLASQPTGHLDQKDLRSIESLLASAPKNEVKLAEKYDTIANYLEKWVKHNDVQITYDDKAMFRGKIVEYSLLIDYLILDADREKVRYSERALNAALNIFLHGYRQKIVSTYAAKLQYDKDAQFNFKSFLQLLCGEYRQLDEIILRHFIWSVKRKITGQKVVWHIMPVLYGPSGGGKSYTVKYMLEPLKELTIDEKMTILDDERKLSALGKYYVVFFDELDKVEKVGVESLKKHITGDDIAYRRLFTNNISVTTNRATFIGTSNNPIIDLIFDPTSTRRYYQINCGIIPSEKYAELKGLDYLAMWKSVDESKDSPILDHLNELTKVQDTLRSKTSLEEWLEYRVEPSDASNNDGIKPDVAYEDYTSWMDKQGRRAKYSMTKFYREIGKYGVEKKMYAGRYKYALRFKDEFKPGSNV